MFPPVIRHGELLDFVEVRSIAAMVSLKYSRSWERFFTDMVGLTREKASGAPDEVQRALFRLLQSSIYIAVRHNLLSTKRGSALEDQLQRDEPDLVVRSPLPSEAGIQGAMAKDLLQGVMLDRLQVGRFRVISIEFYADCVIIRWLESSGHEAPPGLSWLALRDDAGSTYTAVAGSVSGFAAARGETVFAPALAPGASVLTITDDMENSVDVHLGETSRW